MDRVQQLARGRVWTGRDAKEIGLVDELGGLRDAIDYAADKAGIKDQKVAYYPEVKENKLAMFLEQLEASEEMKISQSQLALPHELVEHYQHLKNLESYQGMQMRMPYVIEVR